MMVYYSSDLLKEVSGNHHGTSLFDIQSHSLDVETEVDIYPRSIY